MVKVQEAYSQQPLPAPLTPLMLIRCPAYTHYYTPDVRRNAPIQPPICAVCRNNQLQLDAYDWESVRKEGDCWLEIGSQSDSRNSLQKY